MKNSAAATPRKTAAPSKVDLLRKRVRAIPTSGRRRAYPFRTTRHAPHAASVRMNAFPARLRSVASSRTTAAIFAPIAVVSTMNAGIATVT